MLWLWRALRELGGSVRRITPAALASLPQWACCPYPEATCCDDKQHCCPHQYPVCDVAAGTCRSSAAADSLFVPMRPRMGATDTRKQSPRTSVVDF